jgi:hypothetical protein
MKLKFYKALANTAVLELSEKWIKNRINNMLTTHAEEMLYLR